MSDADYPLCAEPTVPTPPQRSPHPCNRIPATYAEAIARAKRGRPRPRPLPRTRPALRRLVRRWLIDHFDELTDILVQLAQRVESLENRRTEGPP